MGRELRMVPPGWVHPAHPDGYKVPLYEPSAPISDMQADWEEQKAQWDRGKHPEQANSAPRDYPFEEWERRPEAEDYMPYWEPSEATHYMLYETTTEGTPNSPAFESLDELCAWAADNATTFAHFKASAEEWRGMLDDGLVMTKRGNMIFL